MKSKFIVVLALSLGLTSVAEARSQRVEQVPNGGDFQCGICHTNSFPTGAADGARNVFGEQVEQNLTGGGNVATQEVDWQAIYDLDADEDGFTNGEELGDPEGQWQQGDEPAADYEPSDPSDPDDTPDIGDGGEDAGATPDAGAGAGDDAGDSPDAAPGDDSGHGTPIDDGTVDTEEGCSTSGLNGSAPASLVAALLVFGLAVFRRQD
ncbi:MAG: MYXO-CTERM sorting domain-containing protein [Persicimonas sp.]